MKTISGKGRLGISLESGMEAAFYEMRMRCTGRETN
jgi:hypothetical protein